MKRIMALAMCFIICLTFTGCSMLYKHQNDAIDNFDVGYSKVLRKAFAAAYNWDGTDEAKSIVIPEEYDGMKIIALGGYTGRGYPCGFGIDIDDSYLNELCSEANEWGLSNIYKDIESVDTIYLSFDIHISKNVEEITDHLLNFFYSGYYVDYADGGKSELKMVIVPLYSFTCDEDNEAFYAQDGKLYRKRDDKLVSDIMYYDFDVNDYKK